MESDFGHPPVEADFEALQRSATVSQNAREKLRTRKWAAFDAMRREVAEELGKPFRPLLAFDQGRTELAARILESGEHAEAHVDHVLAIARAEALEKGTMQFLTGAIFGKPSWRNAHGKDLDDVSGVGGVGGVAPIAATERKPARSADLMVGKGAMAIFGNDDDLAEVLREAEEAARAVAK